MKTIRVPVWRWRRVILWNALWFCLSVFLMGWMYSEAMHEPILQDGFHLGTDPGVELKDGP